MLMNPELNPEVAEFLATVTNIGMSVKVPSLLFTWIEISTTAGLTNLLRLLRKA